MPSSRAMGDPTIQVAGTPQVVAVTASPMTYTNQSPGIEVLYFTVPTGVTASLASGGVTLQSSLTPAATTIPMTCTLRSGQAVVFTYSAGAPTLTRDVM